MTRCESYPPCFGTIYFPTAPCYFQLKIVITQPESEQFLPWHPQDLHAYMYSTLR